MKPLIGVVTFGNIKYTKMCIQSILDSCDIDIFSVIGKPDDQETEQYFNSLAYRLNYIKHSKNKGFPESINDIYDYAFIDNDYDCVIIVGNDVLVYDDTFNKLFNYYPEYDWISATEVSVNALFNQFPHTRHYFTDDEKRIFVMPEFNEWKYIELNQELKLYDLNKFNIVGDSHNCCLFSKRLFEKVGYIDSAFYPAYFEDNDYARRCQLLNIPMLRISNAYYFHFWSRTVHEVAEKKKHDKFFRANKEYYINKWGGEPGSEKYTIPFNSQDFTFGSTIIPKTLKISERNPKIVEEFIDYVESRRT